MSLADFAACVLSPYANKKRANVSDNRLSLHQTPTYAGPVSADLLPKTLSVALIITQKDTAPLKQPALIKEAPPLYPLIILALPTLQVTPELFACVCVRAGVQLHVSPDGTRSWKFYCLCKEPLIINRPTFLFNSNWQTDKNNCLPLPQKTWYLLMKRVLFLCESRTESVTIPFLNSARSDRRSSGGFMRWRELVLSLY